MFSLFYLSIIMDAMDQRKTCAPFFNNPPQNINAEQVLKTKLVAAMVHGHGTYLYWATEQIAHDTNLTVECLRRTILKYHAEKGFLPPTLYLQLDNASDNKSKQLLAFIAYLVEKRIFNRVKVSYLIVGHTHEDVDQYFSCLSRYIKKVLTQILSVTGLISALFSCFQTPSCRPKCVEQITYCYDTSTLGKCIDPKLARFALPEKTGDAVHYFLFRRNDEGVTTLNYKLKRYCDALEPRHFKKTDNFFDSETQKTGQIINCAAIRDITSNEKYWEYLVSFKCGDGYVTTERIFKLPANTSFIRPFLDPKILPAVDQFPLAAFAENFAETTEFQKAGVDRIMEKLDFATYFPE